MTPLTTIIIPCYNAEPFIGEAIQTAVDQTYLRREIVVIDDGSTDGSLDIIRSFGREVRWETGPNRGGCAARNRGLELAQGELIQFLDADDLLDPSKLEKQIPVVCQYPEDIVYCDYRAQTEAQSSPFSIRAPDYRGEDPVIFILNRSGLQTSAPIHWKKKLNEIGGFRTGLLCSQERDLHLRLACAGIRFRHLPETLYTVRRVSGSVSFNLIRVLDQHSEIAWTARRMLEEQKQLTDERLAALAGFLASDARAYLQHGLPKKAAEYFAQAARMHPDGGIPQAYSGKTRQLYRWLGPGLTQRLVQTKRRAWGTA